MSANRENSVITLLEGFSVSVRCKAFSAAGAIEVSVSLTTGAVIISSFSSSTVSTVFSTVSFTFSALSLFAARFFNFKPNIISLLFRKIHPFFTNSPQILL